ncbi:MAG: hypothetical protein NZ889_02010 [Candidatus Pacearchaeota archaeon]|nr:hypothetical protein [Candidatus Pacearchaeota archaeon]
MLIQKFNKRKREKEFFGISLFPLVIFISLFLALLFLKYPIPKFAFNGTFLNLEKLSYRGDQQLEGKLVLNFSEGEFLPLNTTITFRITAYYPWYYVCEDGSSHEWVSINGTSKISGNQDTRYDSPEYYFCGSPSEFIERSCLSYGKKCCPNGVAGKVYSNLNCSNTPKPLGYCGYECIPSKDVFTLQHLISKSTTPTKGNFSEGIYRFFDWTTNMLVEFPFRLSGRGVGYCYNTTFSIHPQNYPSCNDTDGKNIYFKGTCRDIYSAAPLYDECLGYWLVERHCAQGSLIEKHNCAQENCTNVKCRYNGTDSEGWWAECFMAGITPAIYLKKIKYEECSELPQAYAPICLESPVEGWYEPYRCEAVLFEGEGCRCENGVCFSELQNCSNWNNRYEIPLQNLGLQRTPRKGAYYFLTVNIEYNNTFIIPEDSLKVGFYVLEQATHKKCVNNRCVVVAGEGEDECYSDIECRSCIPNWTIVWGPCINGIQYGNVTDLNRCFPSRMINRTCQIAFESVWECEWQRCSGEVQEKICLCVANCDQRNTSYVAERRRCCIEKWICSNWSNCENNYQTRTCRDLNNCNTTFYKPDTKKRCEKTSAIFLWLLLVIAVFTVIFILFAQKKLNTNCFFQQKKFVYLPQKKFW